MKLQHFMFDKNTEVEVRMLEDGMFLVAFDWSTKKFVPVTPEMAGQAHLYFDGACQ